MICYPIIIPTVNRYRHLKKCIESLAANKYADETELIIGVDYPPSEQYVEGNKEILEYVNNIKGFKKVTVFKRENNYGSSNSRHLKEYALQKYDAVIYSEDDNVFSPFFLEYMNWALNNLKDDERVSTVSGYLQEDFYNLSSEKMFLTYTSSAWGLGRWKNKEQYFNNIFTKETVESILFSFRKSIKIWLTIPSNLYELLVMYKKDKIYGDLIRSCLNIINNTYQLRPGKTLVLNKGQDGSGLHSKKNDTIQNQKIDVSFRIQTCETINLPVVRFSPSLYFMHLSSNRIKAILQVVNILYKYVVFLLIRR